MMTVEQLDRIALATKERNQDRTVIRIAACMATGGIAAGSQAVMDLLLHDWKNRADVDVQVVRKGCIGMCRLDPLVDVFVPLHDKVTYVKMTPERMQRVMVEHILGGIVVQEYTLHVANDRLLNDYTELSS